MRIKPLGHALSIFFVISFSLCIAWGLVMPDNLHMHEAWSAFLPGFNWSVLGVLIGLLGAYLYGWYIALVFVPLFNLFHKKVR